MQCPRKLGILGNENISPIQQQIQGLFRNDREKDNDDLNA